MTCRLTGLLLLLISGTATALESIRIDWGDIAADGWRLEEVGLVLDLDASGRSRLSLTAARVTLDRYRFHQLRLVCAVFEWSAEHIDCPQGTLSLRSEQLDVASAPAALNYRLASGKLSIVVRELPVAQGSLALALTHERGGVWQVDTQLERCALQDIAQLLATAGVELPALSWQGALSGSLTVDGGAQGLRAMRWNLRTEQAGYSNAAGTQAGEALALSSRGSAMPEGSDWRVQASLAAQQGMLYADPVYLEFSDAHRLLLDAQALWRSAGGELHLQSLAFRQAGVAEGHLQGVLAPGAEQPLQRLELTLEQAWLPGLYANWLQPWLAGTVLGELETDGRLQGRLQLAGAQPQALELQLQQVTFRETGGLFAVQGLDADLHWDDSDSRRVSQLAWQGAAFHRLQLGAAALALETAARELKLREPLAVPLLDGMLHVDQFEFGLDDKGLRWLLDGILTPVSMQSFSSALGWPTMAGKLSGVVPRVRYRDHELTVGGILLVQAFDGDITVRNLRIREPLGLAPRLWADIRLANLDLDMLTRTFSFGRIEGRLQGQVSDLYMEAWQPAAFDAVLQTPPDDDSRHRISQKAVDTISDLGGSGVGGALSRGFLQMLEDFPYKRLGIRCRLENGICDMGGVAPTESGGYYLVEPRLLPPRLAVVGYSQQVDWDSLVQRLIAATSGTPSVAD